MSSTPSKTSSKDGTAHTSGPSDLGVQIPGPRPINYAASSVTVSQMDVASAGIVPDLIERTAIPVMFVRAVDDPAAIRLAWATLEERLGALEGRKFFGAFDVATSEYRACVQIRDRDDPAAFGFESATLPGGKYLRARLRGEPPAVYDQISSTFAALAEAAVVDKTRPSIEFYRRRDEIDLLLPVTT